MRTWLTNIKRAISFGATRTEEPVVGRRVLFVCMGNICRSPTAEGVFRKLVQERAPDLAVEVDSAGTHGYHTGAHPDVRARR